MKLDKILDMLQSKDIEMVKLAANMTIGNGEDWMIENFPYSGGILNWQQKGIKLIIFRRLALIVEPSGRITFSYIYQLYDKTYSKYPTEDIFLHD